MRRLIIGISVFFVVQAVLRIYFGTVISVPRDYKSYFEFVQALLFEDNNNITLNAGRVRFASSVLLFAAIPAFFKKYRISLLIIWPLYIFTVIPSYFDFIASMQIISLTYTVLSSTGLNPVFN